MVLAVNRSLSSRRQLLLRALAACGAGMSARALAFGKSSEVGIGQVQYRGDWNARPGALRRLLWETAKRTSIFAAREPTPVRLSSRTLFDQPLLMLSGAGPLPKLSRKERERLARHLRYGGTLWVDAQGPDTAFLDGVREMLTALFPTSPLRPLSKEHVLFKSFFLLDHAYGRTDVENSVLGVELAGRTPVLVTQNDVLGAYERDRFGTWRFTCEPGGSDQRERAFRFGVNVMMYATCLDYKADQVHIPFILKKKRR